MFRYRHSGAQDEQIEWCHGDNGEREYQTSVPQCFCRGIGYYGEEIGKVIFPHTCIVTSKQKYSRWKHDVCERMLGEVVLGGVIGVFNACNHGNKPHKLGYTSYCSYTSSTAQGGGGSFKNQKPIGEVGCCESRMAE